MIRVPGSSAWMALAICFRSMVLPALGGETIRPRVPLPIGATRSTIRMLVSPDAARWNRSQGSMAVRILKGLRPQKASGVRPQTDSTEESSGPFGPFLMEPVTAAPSTRPYSRMSLDGTATSLGLFRKENKGSRSTPPPLLVIFKTPPAVLGMKRISPPAGQF